MAINFYRNHDKIISAYKEVLDSKCNTDWALFGYENQSNDLTLVGKGNGGLDELQNKFSQSKILYAFCEVKDVSLNFKRFLLINWQGECAPLQRKGLCMNHFSDVRNFFKDANIVLECRHEDDVEPDVLRQHVQKLASRIRIDKNNLNQQDPELSPSKPVGTNYQRTIAQKEISLKERESFWKKQKQEEEERLKEEKLRRNSINNNYDQNEIRKNSLTSSIPLEEDRPSLNQSSQLRKERLEEAKSLISKNSINSARAFFEQNSNSRVENQSTKSTLNSSNKISNQIRAFETNTINSHVNNVEHAKQNGKTEPTIPKQEIKPEVETKSMKEMNGFNQNHNTEEVDEIDEKDIESNDNQQFDQVEDESEEGEESLTNSVPYAYQQQFQNYYTEPRHLENIEEDEEIDEDGKINDKNVSQGLRAKALYDYQAADDTEISFDPDDVITHIEQIDEGWWQGLAPNGVYGLFPANYVELID